MIARIIEASLRQRAFVLLAAVALLLVGLWSAARLPIDAVPDITNEQVQVNTEVPALAPEEIEKLVTDYRQVVEHSIVDPLQAPSARALWDKLMAPIAAEIPDGSRVIVIPDGPLHGLF